MSKKQNKNNMLLNKLKGALLQYNATAAYLEDYIVERSFGENPKTLNQSFTFNSDDIKSVEVFESGDTKTPHKEFSDSYLPDLRKTPSIIINTVYGKVPESPLWSYGLSQLQMCIDAIQREAQYIQSIIQTINKPQKHAK